MRFRLIQFLAGAIIALFTQSVGAATPTERPMNVLFLVADDLNSWMSLCRQGGRTESSKACQQWSELYASLYRRAGLFAISHGVLFRCSPLEIGYLQQRADHQQ